MKTFVDNVCRQVVERHLLCHLPSVFSPESVAAYDEDELRRIAAETPGAAAKRKQLERLRDDLKEGLDDLSRVARAV